MGTPPLQDRSVAAESSLLHLGLMTVLSDLILQFRWVRARLLDPPERRAARLLAQDPTAIGFRCNLCGAVCTATPSQLGREDPSCWGCDSTVRQRAVVHMLSAELLGTSLPLKDFQQRKDLVGIGLSDARQYAQGLESAFSYTNTFLHRRPRLDILDPPPELHHTLDFLIASDVFEHVRPPVRRAFEQARRMLKPGGRFFFTAPYDATPGRRTIEHFPRLHAFRMEPRPGGGYVLHNVTADGLEEVFENPVFHGGHGLTLEMRLFSLDDLRIEFARAGFGAVRIAQPAAEWGVVWSGEHSLPIVATAA